MSAKESKQRINLDKIKAEVDKKLKDGKVQEQETQVLKRGTKEYVLTGIPGFDALFEKGIPKGNAMIIAGGTGTGKTIMCLQICNNLASEGKKCLYMSFEESQEKLESHMREFNWDPKKLEDKGNLFIQRLNPFEITRNVEALLAEAKGELMIEAKALILPQDFTPDIIIIDSLTAVASVFISREDSYRIYIEQLFRAFEDIGATSFLITETDQMPTKFSPTGVEEFLGDGVIVLYSVRTGNVRENGIEVLKLRGAKHQKKIVAMQITDKGIVVYPDQEVLGLT